MLHRASWLGQSGYVNDILVKFGMQDAKSVVSPVDTSTKLVSATDEDVLFDQRMYRSAIGKLLYLSTSTRPDIAFAIGNVAKFSNNPTRRHWMEIKRIFRYLKGTPNLGLLYSRSKSEDLVGYSDSDWGGDVESRRSKSGYLFQFCGAPISWKSKRQASVALSTAEAEYIAVSIATQKAVWLRRLMSELKVKQEAPTILYEDNQATISMTSNVHHGRSKHIDIKYHFVREKVYDGTVELRYCRSGLMLADMLTKGLSGKVFESLRTLAGIVPIPLSFWKNEKECWNSTLQNSTN